MPVTVWLAAVRRLTATEAFIRRMIAEGYATEDDTMSHNGVLVWTEGAAIRHPGEGPERADRKRILFQLVPEGKRRGQTTDWAC